jgi:hypothetical protein
MAPKNKGKKGKNADDDAFWWVVRSALILTYNIGAHYRDEVGTSNNLSSTTNVSNEEPQPSASQPSAFSSFAALGVGDGPGQVDEEEDFGGLMVRFHFDRLASGSDLVSAP